MARGLLSFSMVMRGAILAGTAGMSAACLIPPDLEPAGADAGPSAPPIIRSAGPPQYAFPGPILLDRVDSEPMSLTIDDADKADTLYVQFYVDYVPLLNPTPALASCQKAPADVTERKLECDTNTLCNSVQDDGTVDHKLEAMAADRAFIADSEPEAEGQAAFRALTDVAHASWTISSWVMRCNPTL